MLVPEFPWWAMVLLAIFSLATAVQLMLYWFVYAPFVFRLPLGAGHSPSANTGVSVIVCARNAAQLLPKNLPPLLEQQVAGAWEVVVVDDASEDGTPAVLESFAARFPHLRIVRVEQKIFKGKKFALEQGVRAARFETLLFTDADCTPNSAQWLSLVSDKLLEKNTTRIVLGHGPFRTRPGWMNAWSRFENTHVALQYLALASAGLPYMGVGRNLGWKKSVFDQIGGFERHKSVVSGDDDLLVNAVATKKNTVVCLYPETFMVSDAPSDWRAWLRQKQRHIRSGHHYRPGHQALLTILALSHVLHYFCMFTLLFLGIGTTYVISLYGVRFVSAVLLNRRLYNRWGEQGLLPRFWLFDVWLAVYYGIMAPFFLINKSLIAWT
ncbi:MAG: glycosyltransferase [Saprospiraceae bacterium]|nr:glycosyltransferase [Saprospiraceae bacterium]